MNKEEFEKLLCDVNDLISIYDNNSPITNDGFDIEKIKLTIKQMAEKCIENKEECAAFLQWMEAPRIDFVEAKDNIVFQLVNTEQNKEMLAGSCGCHISR